MFHNRFLVYTCFLAAAVTAVPTNLDVDHYSVAGFGKRDLGSRLGPRLSPGAAIYTRSDPRFHNESLRWTAYSAPTFQFVVEVATEADIVTSINYATKHDMSFLAQGGGHGYSPTLGIIQDAMMINLRQFDQVNFNPADQTVTVGGAANFSTVSEVLYHAEREFTVGSCVCVGAVGAALGGGHGRLQGKHGLSMDAIQSLRVILANGTVVDVSATENQDLLWAMRGAGQNFGIVVSAVLKTFPQTNNGLHYDGELAFTGDKLEAVFELTNKLMDEGWPAELGAGLAFPAIVNKSIIVLSAVYAGPASEARRFIDQYAALDPISFTEHTFTWAELGHKAAGGAIADGCNKDRLRSGHALNQARFHIPTMRQGFDAWANFTRAYPSLAPTSGQLWEVFGTQGIKAHPGEDSAYPHRDHVEILQIVSLDHNDPAISEAANSYAKEWVDRYRQTSGYDQWYVYQNYASDDEPLEAIYGYEPWRLERLRRLKKVYDPDNVFKGYHSFVVEGGE